MSAPRDILGKSLKREMEEDMAEAARSTPRSHPKPAPGAEAVAQLYPAQIGSDMPASSHQLVDGTLKRDPEGITARCECGWASRGHFSSLAASAAFQDHHEKATLHPAEKG